MAWTQDLAGAYRQFPVRRPDDCYVAIITPHGVYLFRHHALAFGAVASVWAFNRCGDALTVRSSFEAFTAMFRTLGLRMKEAKAAPPNRDQKILGVVVKLRRDHAEVCPHPPRVQKLCDTLRTILESDRLNTEDAHSLAGKLMFLTTSMFGHLGRAALVPIYSRAHGLQNPDGAETLNTGLRDGINTLLSILEELTPRIIPFTSGAPTTCIYTDAFFQMGELEMKPHACQVKQWFPSKAPNYVNGWGLVLRLGSQAVSHTGEYPLELSKGFAPGRLTSTFWKL